MSEYIPMRTETGQVRIYYSLLIDLVCYLIRSMDRL
jgi:hypothetical protein